MIISERCGLALEGEEEALGRRTEAKGATHQDMTGSYLCVGCSTLKKIMLQQADLISKSRANMGMFRKIAYRCAYQCIVRMYIYIYVFDNLQNHTDIYIYICIPLYSFFCMSC